MTLSPARSDGLDIADVLARLTDLGPPSEIRSRGAAEAARALDLDRVLLTSVLQGSLVVEGLHLKGLEDRSTALLETLRQREVSVGYPLVESEIMRRRRAQLVSVGDGSPPGRNAFDDELAWTDHLVAPIVMESRVVGFLHGDRSLSERSVDHDDLARLGTFALCLALVFERAMLRQRLRVQRHELRQLASWVEVRTGELSDRAISLADAGPGNDADLKVRAAGAHDTALRDLLTRREIDVLQLMVQGETNAAIARELVLSSGTVKFHVQNILRKLHATNRAEATSRYLRLTMQRGDREVA
jgi:DNA-binding CsgD family transcriptional regulator